MSHLPHSVRAIAIACIVLTAACQDAVDPSRSHVDTGPALLASGGGGGGGGGGTPLVPGPCVTSVHQAQFGAINLFGKDQTRPIPIPIDFTLSSCSSQTQVVTVLFTDNDHLPVDQPPTSYPQCMLPPFTSAALTLKPGETRKFSMAGPSVTPNPCFIQHIFKETIRASDGTTLATDWMLVAVQSRA